MPFIEIDTDLADIIEEGAKRKMEFGGDARIQIGENSGVGPSFYYVAAEKDVVSKLLKIWSENAAGKTKYEYTENVADAKANGETWIATAGGSLTTMLTFIPT